MSNGVNKVIILGRLGADPEVRFTQAQKQVANLSIATSESWKDKQTGQKQEKTEWHRVIFFDRLAEIAGQYLKKGSQVYIEGRIQTRKWQNQQGVDQYTTEIVANELQMLGGGGQDQGQQQAYVQPQQYAQQAQQPQYQQQQSQQQQYQAPLAQHHNQNQQQQYAQSQTQQQPQAFQQMNDAIPF